MHTQNSAPSIRKHKEFYTACKKQNDKKQERVKLSQIKLNQIKWKEIELSYK